MKQILIATTNPGKIMTIKKILNKLGYEGLSFADLNLNLEEPAETKTTAEEIAAEKIKEQQEADQKELAELRAYKKSGEISKRLAKEGLPDFFKNDTRLLNAEDGDLEKVVKDIKKEYDSYLPKGANHSTVVQTAQGDKPVDPKQVANEKMGEALKELIG